jgi:hypothetical protein
VFSSTTNRSKRRSAVSSVINAGAIGRHAAVMSAASGLVLSGAMSAQAAEAPAEHDSASASSVDAKGQAGAPVSAGSSVQITFDRPSVTSTPAPVIEEPKAAAAVVPATAQMPTAPKASVKAAPAPATATGGANAAMLSAAYAQLGITQDRTAMVEKALGAAGIPVGGIGPRAFLNYGTVVAAPQPGGMTVQSGHVAIYAGNGQVISGGMNGVNATMTHPLSWLTATGGVTFVRA